MMVILLILTAYCMTVTIACPEDDIGTSSSWHAARLSSYWLILGYQLTEMVAYVALYILLSHYIRKNLKNSYTELPGDEQVSESTQAMDKFITQVNLFFVVMIVSLVMQFVQLIIYMIVDYERVSSMAQDKRQNLLFIGTLLGAIAEPMFTLIVLYLIYNQQEDGADYQGEIDQEN